MKRKDYRKPTTTVVMLRHTEMLMTSQRSSASMNVTYEEENWNE